MGIYEVNTLSGTKIEIDADNPQEAIRRICNQQNLCVLTLRSVAKTQANIKVSLLNGKKAHTEYYFLETQKANIITLYHGSPNPILIPEFGKGEDKHDYGRGLYLTPNLELAKEWSVCTGNNEKGYVYRIELPLSAVSVLDFDDLSCVHWIAELMSHRDADKSARYRRLAPIFISKYKYDTSKYDVIKGWRADSSYYSIVKRFVRDEIDLSLIPTLFQLGDLGIQYCIKSQKAFGLLQKEYKPISTVNAKEYFARYNEKDDAARNRINEIVESEQNTMTDVFSKYIKED
jgi:hypothetical protein